MWYFAESDYDSKNVRDATASAVQSHAEELSPLEIFGREALQNAADNPSPSEESGKVKISFRLHELSGTTKEHFLRAMHFDDIAGHLRSASQDETLRKANILLPSPEDIEKPSYILKVLTVEDYGTRGLVGPECDREKNAFARAFPDIPHCFLGLCRTVGDSQKSGPTAGGTHGFGKTVLWKNSRIRTVLFFSSLDQPYVEEERAHYARFFGQVRLPGHYMNGDIYRGEGYFGIREEKLTRAFYDDAARECAIRLGIPMRDPEAKGTTIIIVDFDDPDQSEDEETSMKTLSGLRSSAERYFWPAIVTGRLEVDVGLNASGCSGAPDIARPHLRSELLPFIDLYRAMIAGETSGDSSLRLTDIKIPRGPGEEPRGKGQLAIGVYSGGTEDAAGMALTNTVALVRGAGMVVGYWRIPRWGLGAKDYHAIALGGMAWQSKDGTHDQEHFEKLLALAEPVTHDNWTYNAEALKHWRGSRAAIKEVRDAIVSAVSDLTTTAVTPEGDAAPLLAGMFHLGLGPTPDPDPRDINIEVVEAPHPIGVGSAEHPQYGFTVKITVPQRSRFRAKKKPDSWRVECSCGFLGEGRQRKVIEHVKSRFTAVRTDGGDWHERADAFDVCSAYEEDVKDKQVTYELKGETEPMDPTMASIAKHDLAVQVYRGNKD